MTRSADQQLSDMGAFAAQVLENPAFNEALRMMREENIKAFKATSVRDREGLVLVAQASRLTDKVESTLRGILEAGKFAGARININEVRSESRLRRAVREIL